MKTNTSTSMSSRSYYTPRQAAAALGVEQWRIQRAIKRGVLRTCWRGSRQVIPASSLIRVLGGGAR